MIGMLSQTVPPSQEIALASAIGRIAHSYKMVFIMPVFCMMADAIQADAPHRHPSLRFIASFYAIPNKDDYFLVED